MQYMQYMQSPDGEKATVPRSFASGLSLKIPRRPKSSAIYKYLIINIYPLCKYAK